MDPQSSYNLTQKLNALKAKKKDLLNRYKTLRDINEKKVQEITTIELRNKQRRISQTKLSELDRIVETARETIKKDSYAITSVEGYPEFEPGKVIVLSVELELLARIVAKNTANILITDIELPNAYNFADLHTLLAKTPFTHFVLGLGNHMEQICSKWDRLPYSSIDKMKMNVATKIMELSRRPRSLQRCLYEFLDGTYKEERPLIPEMVTFSVDNIQVHQVIAILKTILNNLYVTCEEFDVYWKVTIPEAIYATTSDLILAERRLIEAAQSLCSQNYQEFWKHNTFPYIRDPNRVGKIVSNCVIDEYKRRLSEETRQVLEHVNKENEILAAPTMDLLLSNILAQLSRQQERYSSEWAPKLEGLVRSRALKIEELMESFRERFDEREKLLTFEYLNKLKELYERL